MARDIDALAAMYGGSIVQESQGDGYPPFMGELSQKGQVETKSKMYQDDRKRITDLDMDISSARQTMDDLNEFGRLNRESSTGSWWQQLTPDKDMFRNKESMEMSAIQSRLGPSQRAPGSGSSSDRDVSLFLRGIPSTDNNGPTNKGIREDFERKYKYAVSKRTAMQRYIDKYGHLNGFDDQWSKEQAGAQPAQQRNPSNIEALLDKYK